jgi:hypothetical protein
MDDKLMIERSILGNTNTWYQDRKILVIKTSVDILMFFLSMMTTKEADYWCHLLYASNKKWIILSAYMFGLYQVDVI